jgi:hypothetical protein
MMADCSSPPPHSQPCCTGGITRTAEDQDVMEALSLARAALKSRAEDYPEINLADRTSPSNLPASKIRTHCIETLGDVRFQELCVILINLPFTPGATNPQLTPVPLATRPGDDRVHKLRLF